MTKDRMEDQDRIESEDVCIDDQDRTLNPIGRFFRAQRHARREQSLDK